MKKKRISGLIFSKDNIGNLIELVSLIYNMVDEIVIIDSSIPYNKKLLLHKLSCRCLSKVKVYPVVALGHPEPYQIYGLDKCKNDWIFYIDTDEKPNQNLINDIREIVNNAKSDAFLVRKKEQDKYGHLYFNSYQRRIYKKKTAIYSGDVFQDPKINGREKQLDQKYYMNHHFEYYENPDKSYNKYFIISAYEARKSYADIFSIFAKRPIANNFLRIYTKITRKTEDEELSRFDYKFVHAMIGYLFGSVIYAFAYKKKMNLNFILHNYFYILKEFDSFFDYNPNSRKLQLAITHEIAHKNGVINYLHIDDDMVERLRRRYDNNKINGVKLFTLLLEQQYKQDLAKQQMSIK